MTDTELDELLDQWTDPRIPEGSRTRLRLKLAAPPPRRRSPFRWAAFASVFAGAMFGMVLCFAVLARAYPQVLTGSAPSLRIPYLAETRFMTYSEDGLHTLDMTARSFVRNGTEVMLDEKSPGNRLRDIVRGLIDGSHLLILRFFPDPAPTSAGISAAEDNVRSGCSDRTAIAHDRILGYATAVQQSGTGATRMTVWYAPDLGCFPLRARTETRLPDGTYRLERQRETVNVTMSCRTRDASGTCIERYSKYPFQ